MHDPNTLAFRIDFPFGIEIWHVDPCIGGDDNSSGWAMPRLNEAQRERALAIGHEWKTWLPTPSYDFNWSGVEIIWSMWLDVKWQERRRRDIGRDEMQQIFNLACNPVDNLRHCAKRAMAGDEHEIERLARLVYCNYLAHHRPWYRHPRWHFWRWRVQIRALGIAFGRQFGETGW